MEKPQTKEEVFGHRSLAYELLKAECAMKSISLNLSIIRFANHGKFKKETLKNTERLYSEIRTLRESIGNEFQKLFEGQEKYDTLWLHYAYVMIFRLNIVCMGCLRIYLANLMMAAALLAYQFN